MEIKQTILIRFGELFLKGKNRGFFERKLLDNIKEKLLPIKCEIRKMGNRIFVSEYDKVDENNIIIELCKIFGVHSVSPAVMLKTDMGGIKEYVESIRLNKKTFRVTVNRADKLFPENSTKFSATLGGIILKNNKIAVDLHNPEVDVNVDIRENGYTFIFYEVIQGLNGMPVGTSGNGLLLLSGGIDSPVAGFLASKRGMNISALHFHSYPYTSEQAKEKVLKLAKIVSEYSGNIKIFICNFKEVQEEIHKKCNEEYMITIMRRIMMRIAEKICQTNELQAIITGESLGQVASQTIESITVTNNVLKLIPVIRPVITMDKSEITEIAKKINTFETSILPYEDCCTVFLPKYPIIKPKLEKVIREENKLNIDDLVERVINSVEIIETKNI